MQWEHALARLQLFPSAEGVWDLEMLSACIKTKHVCGVFTSFSCMLSCLAKKDTHTQIKLSERKRGCDEARTQPFSVRVNIQTSQIF